MKSSSKKTPSDGAVNEALQNPNGWVYEIDKSMLINDLVPPSAIIGAWKVDANGLIIGEFLPNPNYLGSM